MHAAGEEVRAGRVEATDALAALIATVEPVFVGEPDLSDPLASS